LESEKPKYYEVLISNPRVDNGKMLVALNIKEWDEYFCFYYPLDNIDHYQLMVHIIWKLSGDDQYIIKAKAQMDIHQKDPINLNIRNWNFI
jgi:hypothetical protein